MGWAIFMVDMKWGRTSWKIVPDLAFGVGGHTGNVKRTTRNLPIDQCPSINLTCIFLLNRGAFMRSSIMLEKSIAHIAIALKEFTSRTFWFWKLAGKQEHGYTDRFMLRI